MSKKTKCPDRKRKTLRRCAWLVVILAVLSVTNLFHATPWQAIGMVADRCDVENPDVVDWFYDGTLPVTRFALHALVQGEDAMMLTVVGFHPLMGWYERSWATAETWDGSGFYAGVYQHGQDEASVGYLFGRIDDPAIETVRVAKCMVNEETWEEYQQEVQLAELTTFERNNSRYILAKIDVELDSYCRAFELTGFDADGNAVKTIEPHWRYWST